MKRIALVGVVESGKSDLAQALKEKLEAKDLKVAVIDGYQQETQEYFNVPVGPVADYYGNLAVVMSRLAMESRVERDEEPDVMITCGTLVESSLYAAVDATDRQTQEALVRIQNFMHIVGVIYQDQFRYDPIFKLECEAPNPKTTQERVQNLLSEGLDSFGANYYAVSGDLEERAAYAMKVLYPEPKAGCKDCDEKAKDIETKEAVES